MSSTPIQFNDGASYARYMGVWSQLVGSQFLDWLAPEKGWRWLDVGCGNGAFTQMLAERCAPAALAGVDPSEAQLAHARQCEGLGEAHFQVGDAMALPFPDKAFDAAVMPLVIFFVPEPAQGVAEMLRVVRPGGSVSAYAWDTLGGGFPYEPLAAELRALGLTVPRAPSLEASRIEVMQALWEGAGLEAVETKAIAVQRTYADFEEFWAIAQGGPSMVPTLAQLDAEALAGLKARLRARLDAEAGGPFTLTARAHAVKGRRP